MNVVLQIPLYYVMLIMGLVMDENVSFTGLEWEVECTEDVKDRLRRKFKKGLKKKLLQNIQLLATGSWKGVANPLIDEKGLKLYQTEVGSNCRIIWENAISYSAFRRVYLDKIRLWKISNEYDISQVQNDIVSSNLRGQNAI